MSAALSSYLAELLAASACHEIVFVQDNCAGPKESNANSSSSSSSWLDNSLNVVELGSRNSFIPELSRWDSSSSLTFAGPAGRNRASPVPANNSSDNNARWRTPQIQAVIAAPQPPRRQTSWEGPVAANAAVNLTACSESSSPDFEYNSTAHSRISCSSDPTDLNAKWRRHQQQQVHCALPCPPKRSHEKGDEKATNSAPRLPPRRTSSRLRRSILRALETRMDRFPDEEETADNETTTTTTLGSLACRALLRTSTELETTTTNTRTVFRRETLQDPTLSTASNENRRQTSRFGMLMMDLKNESIMDLESPSGASLILDEIPSKLLATCTSMTQHHQGQGALEYSLCPRPPRKPQRQGTPEMEVKKIGRHDATLKRSSSSSSSSSDQETKRSNSSKAVCRERDSLQDLIRLRRPGAKPHSL